MTSPAHVSVRGIDKAYGGNKVLNAVSLDIVEGEFIALVGPSGCGKSTLLRVIAGLEAADQGQIAIAGRDVTAARAADRDVAMVFQSYALYPHLTVRQNLMVPLVMRQLSSIERFPLLGRLVPGRRARLAAIRSTVEAVAESLRIASLLDRKPVAMSGGQRQRVALGRAIVRKPVAFLMDEPLSNLDAALRVHTRGEIVDLHRRIGATTIYVTHDQEEALSMADRVAVMKNGCLLQVGPPRQIYDDPDLLEVAEFIGSPKINLTSGEVDDSGTLRLAGREIVGGLGYNRGEVLTLAFRPEHARLGKGAEAPGAHASLPFRFARLEYLGANSVAHGHLPGGEPALVQTDTNFVAPGAGGQFTLSIPHSHLLIFDRDGRRIRTRGDMARPGVSAGALHG